MSLRTQTGAHFKDPWLMLPMTNAASNVPMYDTTNTVRNSDTVAFFTGLAGFGATDTTNWSSNTYKTIYSHTGRGLVHACVGPTAGGAATTTFEMTVDGVLSEITVTNANTERAFLLTGAVMLADFTTVNTAQGIGSSGNALDAGLSTIQAGVIYIPPMRWAHNFGIPLLRYDVSMLIRMKHSAAITNSTATAYSGVMVRKGIAA